MNLELETVATTYDLFEAEFLRNQLAVKGFNVYLEDDNIVGVFNLLAPAVGGIKIRVLSDEAEEAAEMIDDLRNAEIVYHQPSDEFRDDWRCDGMVQSLDASLAIGLKISNAENLPAFKQSDEFAKAQPNRK